jgi:hypothetical protein
MVSHFQGLTKHYTLHPCLRYPIYRDSRNDHNLSRTVGERELAPVGNLILDFNVIGFHFPFNYDIDQYAIPVLSRV